TGEAEVRHHSPGDGEPEGQQAGHRGRHRVSLRERLACSPGRERPAGPRGLRTERDVRPTRFLLTPRTWPALVRTVRILAVEGLVCGTPLGPAGAGHGELTQKSPGVQPEHHCRSEPFVQVKQSPSPSRYARFPGVSCGVSGTFTLLDHLTRKYRR